MPSRSEMLNLPSLAPSQFYKQPVLNFFGKISNPVPTFSTCQATFSYFYHTIFFISYSSFSSVLELLIASCLIFTTFRGYKHFFSNSGKNRKKLLSKSKNPVLGCLFFRKFSVLVAYRGVAYKNSVFSIKKKKNAYPRNLPKIKRQAKQLQYSSVPNCRGGGKFRFWDFLGSKFKF